jgi:hypothetical protein
METNFAFISFSLLKLQQSLQLSALESSASVSGNTVYLECFAVQTRDYRPKRGDSKELSELRAQARTIYSC